MSWMRIAAAIGVALGAGTGLYIATKYLQANHEQVQRIRNAKRKYRDLLTQLSESKKTLNYIDSKLLPQAEQVVKIQADVTSNADFEEKSKKMLLGIGEEILRLMENIDSVTPALVVEAAGLEPWTEHDPDLKQNAVRQGYGVVLELAGDVRAIRKSLIQKAERRAKRVDALKSKVEQEL
ncbi:hypothetical protein IWW36_000528 [Coemansia brasiliensis]|uniref:Uncharacterized protein n=1 Tax=Coemansia brasiliensis TaxID=2650707 RepID=A0A9W8M1Q9_9FUNG|nr:hypothetical protein IWW36_000528 [Coemansia brasiliensis]